MAVKKKKTQLDDLVVCLTRSFEQWDHIYKNGCQDPFYCDGVNLNLVRNHILSWKRQIDELLRDEHENTLFSTPYPDIYYKPTPEEVSYDYMAQPEQIRNRAQTEMAKYEADPDFQYLCDHYKEAFPNGETKATKAAGIYPGQFTRFVNLRKTVERGDLVEMRNRFWKSYEEQQSDLKACADKLRDYLAIDHSKEDNTPILDDFYEDEYDESNSSEVAEKEPLEPSHNKSPETTQKPSLDVQINFAKTKAESQPPPQKQEREEQLSLF